MQIYIHSCPGVFHEKVVGFHEGKREAFLYFLAIREHSKSENRILANVASCQIFRNPAVPL